MWCQDRTGCRIPPLPRQLSGFPICNSWKRQALSGFPICKPCLDMRQNPSRNTHFPSYGRRPFPKPKPKKMLRIEFAKSFLMKIPKIFQQNKIHIEPSSSMLHKILNRGIALEDGALLHQLRFPAQPAMRYLYFSSPLGLKYPQHSIFHNVAGQ